MSSPADGITRNAHARPRNLAAIDGIAYGHIGTSSALGAHISLGGKARKEIGFGRCSGLQDALWDGLLHRLQVFSSGVQEKVCVGVDQPRHQRGVAEIDNLRIRRMLHLLASLTNAIADDEDFAG